MLVVFYYALMLDSILFDSIAWVDSSLIMQELNKATTKVVLKQLKKIDWEKYEDYTLKVRLRCCIGVLRAD